MEIENEINNNIKIEKNNFFNNIIGQTIKSAIDIGLKAILPDLIENQVIDIKNALFKEGLQSGIDTAIDSVMHLKKSAEGIITGNFENISQIQSAIGDGGIVDTISDLLDKAIKVSIEKDSSPEGNPVPDIMYEANVIRFNTNPDSKGWEDTYQDQNWHDFNAILELVNRIFEKPKKEEKTEE